ncbi:MATE family efflux transporter [Limoniibacter endophyticus]|uniref:MATE family efflux transporter n=1 Tax=Limoniibacter endophyticus TaxID=1565040 RepID=A0A8J3DQ72_9HYPH|nr:MATE family efflux transporter [Limoniibacter endophyticus]GHC73112.1 MATE family efflux transporter [Limoniibacter endophyticus]
MKIESHVPGAGVSPRPFDVSHWDILRIAIPMMIAHISTPLVGLVATGVIGQLGDEVLIGGVALAAVIFDVIFLSFNFLRGATTGFIAQAVGAADRRQEQIMLLGGIVLALGAGLFILVLHIPIGTLGLTLLGADSAVAQAAQAYFDWRIWSAPFVFFNFVAFGWIIGRGEALAALLLQTLLNGLNIALSFFLVLHLHWGVAGAAIASLIAEAVTALVGVVLILMRTDKKLWDWRAALMPVQLKRLFSVNRDMMIRSIALLAGISFFTRQSGMLGIEILAANTILIRFYFIGVAFLDGIATAAEQLAGRAVGAQWRPAFDRVIKLTTIWGFVFGALVSAVFALIGFWVIALIAPNQVIIDISMIYLPYVVVLPLVGVIAFQMDGVFIGATWSREMRNMMLLSLGLYLAAWAVLQPFFGNHGLWMAMLIFQGARSVFFRRMMPRLASRTFMPQGSL